MSSVWFDESEHPRAPQGSPTGGQFVSKGGSDGSSEKGGPSKVAMMMTLPNGIRTAAFAIKIPEQQENTPEFKKWFGNSKVVDKEGTPLVVYHGTTADFTSFDIETSAEGGFWFSEDPQHASEFALTEGGRVIPTYLKIMNPLMVHGSEIPVQHEREDLENLIERAHAEGKDGIFIKDFRDLGATGDQRVFDTWVAFKPTQIKSATGNIGKFNPRSKNILALGVEPILRDSILPTQSIMMPAKNDWKSFDKINQLEVLVNPSSKDIRDLAKGTTEGRLRVLFDKHDNVFAWGASEAVHAEMATAIVKLSGRRIKLSDLDLRSDWVVGPRGPSENALAAIAQGQENAKRYAEQYETPIGTENIDVIEHLMKPRVDKISAIAKQTAIEQDYNPNLIFVDAKSGIRRVGQRQWAVAASASTDGKIQLHALAIQDDSRIPGFIAHEVEHQKYWKLMNDWVVTRKEYPNGSLAKRFDEVFVKPMKRLHETSKNISEYATSWWEAAEGGQDLPEPDIARNETLAEIARIEKETGKLPPNLSPEWKAAYDFVNEHWTSYTQKLKEPVSASNYSIALGTHVIGYNPGVHAIHNENKIKETKASWILDSPIRTLEQALEAGPKAQSELAEVAEAVSGKLGITFSNPGPKNKSPEGVERIKEKVILRGSVAAVTDIARGTFIINHPKESEIIAEELGKHFEVVLEDWRKNGEGYLDRAAMVRFQDGLIGEIQFMDAGMANAKSDKGGNGHGMYVEWRSIDTSMPKGATRAATLKAKMLALYGVVTSAYSPEWKAVLGNAGT